MYDLLLSDLTSALMHDLLLSDLTSALMHDLLPSDLKSGRPFVFVWRHSTCVRHREQRDANPRGMAQHEKPRFHVGWRPVGFCGCHSALMHDLLLSDLTFALMHDLLLSDLTSALMHDLLPSDLKSGRPFGFCGCHSALMHHLLLSDLPVAQVCSEAENRRWGLWMISLGAQTLRPTQKLIQHRFVRPDSNAVVLGQFPA